MRESLLERDMSKESSQSIEHMPTISSNQPTLSSVLAMAFYHRKLMNQSNTTMGKGNGLTDSPAASPRPAPVSQAHPFPVNPWPLISGDHDHSYQIHIIQIGLTIAACTVGVFLFFIAMFKILANYYSRRSHFRTTSTPIIFDINGDSPFSDDEGPAVDHPIWFIRTVGLSQSVIDSITVCKYRKDEGLIDGTECSVCLSEFEEDESLKLLPKCNHAFHVACIDTWLSSHKNCPLCRAPVVRETASTEEIVGEASSNVSGVEDEERQMELNLEDSGGPGGHRVEEGGSSGLTVGDDSSVLLEIKDGGYTEMVPERTMKNSLFLTDSAVNGHEDEEEIQPVRRSISVDSCSASMIYGVVMDLNLDAERQRRQLDVARNSRAKSVGGSTIYKLASIGRALQKRPICMKRSFAHKRKSRSTCRHGRSQSSTLPL